MAKLVRMGVVAPPDVDFEMPDGTRYRISGDISLPIMLRFARLEQRLVQCQEDMVTLQADADADDAAYETAGERMVEALEDLQEQIVDVLRVHTPGLEECPFSQHQIGRFLAYLRGALEDELGEDDTPPTRAATTTNRAARRASTPSSGSRASRSNSAGRRTPGSA